ncbi:hypothetical protein [Streptomyces sp. IBSBF 2435]|uniref:hypothetical protein n=1 Tax=Streptomyces sp. IBSBF 2435 TaxID=2903531 RepID=UPI002FDC0D42
MVTLAEGTLVPDKEQQTAAYAPPTTREGWQQFVGTPPLQPPPDAGEDWSNAQTRCHCTHASTPTHGPPHSKDDRTNYMISPAHNPVERP